MSENPPLKPSWRGLQTTPQSGAPRRTIPPGKYVVLYDGHCKLCTRGACRLTALARAGAVETVDFQEPGALARFPGLTHDACMQAMYLVAPDGRLFRGCEAAVRAVATRPLLAIFAFAYYLPGIRQLCDRLYAWLAANRYRLFGKNSVDECAEGTCALHFPRTLPSARKQQEVADNHQPKQGEPL
jgi:predicted DCC family thiol-disulfide oxidoreductase YuxK